jgi:hypothetical protein
VLALEQPLTALWNPTARCARSPASDRQRVILEVLATGGSPTVEQAVAASDRAEDVSGGARSGLTS